MYRSYIFFLITILLSVHCSNDSQWKQLPSGLQYMIHNDREGEAIAVGDTIIFSMVYRVEDSVHFNSYDLGEKISIIVEEPAYGSDIMEGFILLSEGDSASFLTSTDSINAQLQHHADVKRLLYKENAFVQYDVKIIRHLSGS